ncbi:hypothetical protein MIB92_06365 [Aestuariirhabdus sp. Z084]|uniref:hypothetical protein n=1 Tax=Aestuariirhabdus haliotis TaxID=2918751 RepID=UPI00201B3BD3|nr:hypothetical protein [Aestuariirhabdus haliotis]MCL6415266.1 hypothetical protein [Aestuariirhabdus haliotis]MCL6419526.1 hypothetical protein [Aestuariirhabdus haliotis]
MNKLILSLALISASSLANAGDVFQGEQAAIILVGNTLEANYRPVGSECGKRVFYEYYDPDGKIYGLERRAEQAGSYTHYVGHWKVEDGKLCTSVYGRSYSCSNYEKIGDNTYQRQSDNMKLDKVKLHKGKYRPCF